MRKNAPNRGRSIRWAFAHFPTNITGSNSVKLVRDTKQRMKEPANALTLSAIAIISADAELAELVSSHFRFPRTYVVLLEAPPKRLVEFGVYAHDYARGFALRCFFRKA